MTAQMSDGLKKAMGGEGRKVIGKTVGELLIDLKIPSAPLRPERRHCGEGP
jgi:hypothetical protein